MRIGCLTSITDVVRNSLLLCNFATINRLYSVNLVMVKIITRRLIMNVVPGIVQVSKFLIRVQGLCCFLTPVQLKHMAGWLTLLRHIQ
jgi:hypothetical protein